MVFGALLGGAVTRAGERFQEEAERQRRTEDWQRQNNLNLQVDFFAKNYGNMTPEQHEASLMGFAPLIGMTEKQWRPLVGGLKAIHSTLPPQYMDEQGLGASRSSTGSVAVTPSKEPAVRGIEAPASIKIGQIPQPADIGTPSIYAPTSGHTASLPSQTPNEVFAQKKFEQDKAIRQQQMKEIKVAGLTPELEQASIGKLVGGINAVPVITSKIGADSRERMATDKLNEIKATPRFVIRGDQQLPVYRRGEIETFFDPEQGQEVRYQFRSGDKVYEKSSTTTGGLQLIQDDRGTYAVNKSGIAAGTPGSVTKVPGLGGRPQPQSQITTVTTPSGPGIAEYTPSRSGKGSLKVIQQGSVKGTVPAVEGVAAKEIAGLGTAYRSLNNLKTILPKISTGPFWGRMRSIQIKGLGGWGATPEEVQAATQINMLMRTSFDTAGASLTPNEKEIFTGIFPGPNDTVETALTKIGDSLKYVQARMEDRKGLLTPMQRSQTQFPDVGGGTGGSNSLSVTAPNGKVYSFPNKEAAEKFRAATGAK